MGKNFLFGGAVMSTFACPKKPFGSSSHKFRRSLNRLPKQQRPRSLRHHHAATFLLHTL